MTLLCLLFSFSLGDIDAEAKELLGKAAERFNQPFAATLEGKMTVQQMGMTLDLSGKIIRKSQVRQVVETNMSMPQGSMSSRMVMDGTMAWTEVNAMGMKQVIKGTIEETKSMGNQMSFDDIMEDFENFADWKSIDKKDGMVTMRGTVKSDSAKGIDAKDIMFTFSEKDFFPYSVTFGNEEDPMMFMTLKDPKPLSARQNTDDFYSYTPPAGVMVMDIKDMPKGM